VCAATTRSNSSDRSGAGPDGRRLAMAQPRTAEGGRDRARAVPRGGPDWTGRDAAPGRRWERGQRGGGAGAGPGQHRPLPHGGPALPAPSDRAGREQSARITAPGGGRETGTGAGAPGRVGGGPAVGEGAGEASPGAPAAATPADAPPPSVRTFPLLPPQEMRLKSG
jgi:hypothetical protein